MKKNIFLFPLLFCANILSAQGFTITLQAPNYKNGIAYLTYHLGSELNIEDSATISPQGVALFTGQRKLPGGIYAIVLPGKNKWVDFFIDQQQVITIKADTTDLINGTVVTGAEENILFQQYQKYMSQTAAVLEKERTAYSKSGTKKDSLIHEKKINQINSELNDYREGIIQKHPTSMMAVMLNAMREPEVLIKKPATRDDSLQNYYYYKQHYWDGISFMDSRIVRTPFFLPKLERYYRNIISQDADSIIREADYQLLLSRTAPELFKFLINWLTDEYIYPTYMGQDAVFVYLFEKYHSKGISNWLNKKQIDIISKRAYMLMANLIGDKAANLEMTNYAGKPVSLYDVKADFTIICFWDPDCGHCKEEIPRLDSIYHAEWKKHNVKIFGVLSATINSDLIQRWTKFIDEHQLDEWVNVYQPVELQELEEKENRAGYHQLYDVTVTPTLYLLDKEKRIIGKKLTWEQTNDLLKVKLGAKQ